MPGILDLVQQSLGDDAVQHISRQIGADPQQAQSAISAALPMLLAGMAHHSQGDGAQAMHEAVTQHDSGLLGNVLGMLGGGDASNSTNSGGNLLGLVLGQHHDTAHSAVAGASGLQGPQVQQLLAMLAPLVMSAVSNSSRAQGLDAGGLAGMLQGEHQQVAQSMGQSQPGLLGLAEQLLGGSAGGKNPLGGLTRELNDLLGGK